MATIDASTSALLKTRASEQFENNVMVGNPVTALIGKKTGIGGKAFQVALQIGNTVARGKRFADVKANVKPTMRVEMDYQFQESYVLGFAPGIDSALASGGGNSIADLIGTEQDVAYGAAGALIEQTIVRGDSYGTIGLIDSVVSGSTGTVVLQLKNFNDCFSISVDDVLAAKSDPTKASLQSGTFTVTATDPMTGQITGTMGGGGNASGWAGYSLGLAATYANSTSPQTMQSLRTLFPRTGLANAFEGLASRASGPVRLAGHVFSVGTMGIKDIISLLVSSIGNFGQAKPMYALVSTNGYLELEAELGDKVRYTTSNGTGAGKGANDDMPSITFEGPRGPVHVISVPSQLDSDVFVIDPSSLTLTTAGSDLIEQTDEGENGSGWSQLQDQDAKRLGLRMLGCLACVAFWKHGRAIRTI